MFSVRPTVTRGAIVVTMAVLLVACGGGNDDPRATAAGGSAATTGSTDETGFPEGSFEHTATADEAIDNGYTTREVAEAFGPDGEMPMTFVFDEGTWQHITVFDDGASEVGDNGTYTVEGDELTTVSESDGCPGCTVVYRWSFDGETLTLELLSDSAGEEDAHGVRLFTEYGFEKTS